MRPLTETAQSIGWLLGLITALWWMGDVILERAANDDLGFGAVHDPWPSDLALVLTASERGEAQALVAEELRQADAAGFVRPRGIALRASGALTHGDAGIELLAASAMLAASPARYHHARSLVDLGAALRRGGRATDAREPLRVGLELAFARGADRLLARARAELLATGARPRRATGARPRRIVR
jgi:hypothetical protein